MNKRILLIEDEQVLRQIIKDMLICLGYQIVTSGNGYNALKKYKESITSGQNFDSVFIDFFSHDGVDERETIDLLRNMDPEVRIIISNSTTSDTIREIKDKGHVTILSKPFTIHELRLTLDKTLHDTHDANVHQLEKTSFPRQ